MFGENLYGVWNTPRKPTVTVYADECSGKNLCTTMAIVPIAVPEPVRPSAAFSLVQLTPLSKELALKNARKLQPIQNGEGKLLTSKRY